MTNATTLTRQTDKLTNATTLSHDYLCDKCGEPAMTNEGGALRCPSCWLREKGQQIKKLDHTGYRP
jgi:uncharacterized Zn finger protein (UPF0148 family)